MVLDYKMPDVQLWSEFSPALYKLSVGLKENGKIIDHKAVDFGMREFKADGTQFEVNGQPVFLRGRPNVAFFL